MPESILTKQIGPFTGGVWLLVIGGGVGLALILRKGFGGGGQQQMPIIVETVPLKPVTTPPVSGPVGAPGGSSVGGGKVPGLPPIDETKKPPVKPPVKPPTKPPVLPPKPVTAIKPVITVFTVLPATIVQGQAITVTWATIYSKKTTLKRQAGTFDVPASGFVAGTGGVVGTFTYVLTAANNAGSTTKSATLVVKPKPAAPGGGGGAKNIPGGYSGTCPTSGPIPPDYLQRKSQSTARYQDRRTKTGWAIFNLGYGGDIFGINTWLANPLNYAVLNRVRDGRGLRALNNDQIAALKRDVAVIAGGLNGKENRLTNAQIMQLWETYNTPYVCSNSPRNTQTRVT